MEIALRKTQIVIFMYRTILSLFGIQKCPSDFDYIEYNASKNSKAHGTAHNGYHAFLSL